MGILEKKLYEIDPVMSKLLKREQERQTEKLIMNAAMSVLPNSIHELYGSVFSNIDAEGYIPEYLSNQSLEELYDINKQIELYKIYRDNRSNKCCEYANIVEALAIKRLARVFANKNASEDNIYVNVQLPTGAIANNIVFATFLNEGDSILSLKLEDGGHLSHGAKAHINSQKYKIINYHVCESEHDLDYSEIIELLSEHQPKMLVVGSSSFPKKIDWRHLRNIINIHSPNTIFLADIAHTAGLIAGKAFPNPIGIADIITMVGYKTFMGPRTGVILTTKSDYIRKINRMVFPGTLGSAQLLNIVALATSAEIANTAEYQELQKSIVKNAKYFATLLMDLGIPVCFNGTDSHIVLLDIGKYYGEAYVKDSGGKVADLLEDVGILVNKNNILGDKNYTDAQGIRIGLTVVTELGINKSELEIVAKIFKEVIDLSKSFNLEKNVLQEHINSLKSVTKRLIKKH